MKRIFSSQVVYRIGFSILLLTGIAERSWPEEDAPPSLVTVSESPSEPRLNYKLADDWTFFISPYGWLPHTEGTVGVKGIESDFKIGVDDLLKNLQLAGLLRLGVTKGKWGFLLDGIYQRLHTDLSPGPFYSDGDYTMELGVIEGQVRYNLLAKRLKLDAVTGFRYMYNSSELDLDAGLLPAVNSKITEDWVDPIIGFRTSYLLSPKWSTTLNSNIGGFGVGSDFTWSAELLFNYKINERLHISSGYRHLDIDYDTSDFSMDSYSSGFVFGMAYQL